MHGSPQALDSSQPELTKREYEVLVLLAKGHTNKMVASDLGVSVRTAEVYRLSVMRKLGFRSMSDLVLYSVRQKLVEL
jgi:DNA-binding NarL/FixJ family response regulator